MKNLNILTPAPGIERSRHLKTILAPILPQLREVESKLNSIAEESNGILKDSSHYVLNGEGKRLRSALVLFCASIQPNSKEFVPLLKSKEEAVIDVGTAVELIHAATLVHDDIVDRSVLRRLKPTVNLQFGEDVAVLLGDFLYSKAFKMIADVGDGLLTSEIASTTQGMCEGEIDQLKNRYRPNLTLEEYFSFIERKTASLISVSALAGARLAPLDKIHQQALAQFALNVGISYQIIDDLLDVIGSESKLGKTLRTDTGNGKMTLPMILLFKCMNPKEKEKFMEGFATVHMDWEFIQTLMTQHEIVEQTRKVADDYFDLAIQSLSHFNSDIKESLLSLSRFVLKRDY